MKRWFLFLAAALLSLAVSAKEEKMIHVFLTDGTCDTYPRSEVESITYEATGEDPSEVNVMRLHLKKAEADEEENGEDDKVQTSDYNLADIEKVEFPPPEEFPWVATRSNIEKTYLTSTLRGQIGGKWKDWPGVKLGFFIGEKKEVLTDENRRTVIARETCDGPGMFTYVATNNDGYVGNKRYYYRAWASYDGEFFLIGGVESFQLKTVTIWTDTYAKVEKEDEKGRYYKAHVSADIFGDTEHEIKNYMVGFCYGPDERPEIKKGAQQKQGRLNETRNIECDILHLDAGSKVWMRPYVAIAGTEYYGVDFQVTIPPYYQVHTFDATDVTATKAKVGYNIEVLAQQEQLKNGVVGIQYSTNPNLDSLGDDTYYDIEDWNETSMEYHVGNFTKLTPNTTYYCRGYLKTDGETYVGNTIEFTTKELDLVTYEAQSVTSTTADIRGELFDTDAIEEGSYFGFFYNTTGNPGYSSDDPYVYGTFGSDKKSKFYWSAKNLKRGTTYYVRSLITYKKKTYVGNMISFTTSNAYEGEKGMFELRGPVYMCIWTNPWGTNYRTYNQSGFWLTGDGYYLSSIYPNGINRDSNGRIIQGKYDEGGVESWTIDQYGRKTTWTDVYYDGGETHTYYYDDNDVVYKETVEYIGMDVEWNDAYTITFDSYVFDSYGNWTCRWAHTSLGENYVETREITYYE